VTEKANDPVLGVVHELAPKQDPSEHRQPDDLQFPFRPTQRVEIADRHRRIDRVEREEGLDAIQRPADLPQARARADDPSPLVHREMKRERPIEQSRWKIRVAVTGQCEEPSGR